MAMINEKKYIKKTYIESTKSKNWMDKNLKPQEQSNFIRVAVSEKINKK